MKTGKILAIFVSTILFFVTMGSTFADRDGDDDRYERDDDRYERDHDDDDDDRYERDDDRYEKKINIKYKKTENKKLKAKYKEAFSKKLGNRLDNISKTKLETIVIIIDTKLTELELDTIKTDNQKERLVAIYGAIRDLITDKISGNSEDDILNGLLK